MQAPLKRNILLVSCAVLAVALSRYASSPDLAPASAVWTESPPTNPSALPLSGPAHSPASPSAKEKPGAAGSRKAEEDPPPDTVFDPQHPTLGGIALGMAGEDVARRFGAPSDRYTLPVGAGSGYSLILHEYDGWTVGFGPGSRVAYVEIASADVATGIVGLKVGESGAKAASALGLKGQDAFNALTSPVAGGMLKIDLDPDTRQVVAIKLIADS